ncbi:MAG TPA: sigma factor-like helix-turn-helix DNA-binding protein, partial [Thermoanaerobaculia bacterium]
KRRREKGFRFVSDEAVTTLLPGTGDPLADAVRHERLRMLLDAIGELPDELAEVVQLRDLDGLDYKEISAFLNLPDGTVKSRLNRARIELAQIVRSRIGSAASSLQSLYSPRAAGATGGGS